MKKLYAVTIRTPACGHYDTVDYRCINLKKKHAEFLYDTLYMLFKRSDFKITLNEHKE